MARRSYNTLFDRRQPVAVATVDTPEQVRACVELARESYLPIAARSGGHSYAGYSVPDSGLVVDLKGLNKVDIQGTTATIGSGARLFDVYTALARSGRCIPAGSCPSVGIGGLTLGGGVGVLSRKFGLTCDKLTAVQVVTADGMLRDVTADTDPDLFWALRGGGGGNFGIVTTFTFTTDQAPDLVVFQLDFPAGAAPAVVGAWQTWVARAPPAAQPREGFVASSRVLTEPLRDPTGPANLLEGRTDIDILFDALGGAVAAVKPADTAFPHREALATVQIYQKSAPDGSEAAARAVAEVRDGLGDLGARGGYVNYIEAAMPDWGVMYYGANLGRLRDIARRYDPDRVFTFPQSIHRA